MTINRASVPTSIWPVHAPVRDEYMGEVLSTTDDHFQVVAGMHFCLPAYARERGLVWLVRAEAALIFPRADGPDGMLFPDILVAFDVDVSGSGPYSILEVGKPPEFVAEILSDETADKDEDAVAGKVAAYAEMGIREYLTFDPRLHKHLALVGYRLVRPGRYEPIPPAPEGGLRLETLGLRVAAEPGIERPYQAPRLRFSATRWQPVLHMDELAAELHALRPAQGRAEHARELAEQAHAELKGTHLQD